MTRASRRLVLKIVRIGNSRGVRLPKVLLDRYAISDALVVEERKEGLLLHRKNDKRLSWEQTFKEMAREREDWRDLEAAIADGLDPEDRW